MTTHHDSTHEHVAPLLVDTDFESKSGTEELNAEALDVEDTSGLGDGPEEDDESGDADILGPIDVWSPAIDRLVRRVSYLIRVDLPGATFWGLQRVGKSHGLTYLMAEMPRLFGGSLACVRFNLDKLKSDESFWQGLIRLAGLPIPYKLEKGKELLLNFFKDKAEAAGATRILIIIDEANRLLPSQYAVLVTIFNELDHLGLRPFMMLVGQPQLATLHIGAPTIDTLQDVGRFFNVVEEILPVRNDEVGAVLESFESVSDEDPKYGARALLPELYAQGFSLAQLEAPIRNAMTALGERHKLLVRISMQYLRSLVVALLSDLYRKNVTPAQLNGKFVIKTLESLGFISNMSAYAEKPQAIRS